MSTRRSARLAVVASVLALGACTSRREEAQRAPAVAVEVADVRDDVPTAPAAPWPELAELPRIEAVRVITLPARADVPRFDVGGPVVAGDLAVVASSQFGFAAVDWRRGTARVDQARRRARRAAARDRRRLRPDRRVRRRRRRSPRTTRCSAACAIVTPAGADQAYVAIHGQAAERRGVRGSGRAQQQVWRDGERGRCAGGAATRRSRSI